MVSTVFGQYGWICPKCQSVYSPTTSECFRCNSQKTQTISTPNIVIGPNTPNLTISNCPAVPVGGA